jgi:hypothetical protein
MPNRTRGDPWGASRYQLPATFHGLSWACPVRVLIYRGGNGVGGIGSMDVYGVIGGSGGLEISFASVSHVRSYAT